MLSRARTKEETPSIMVAEIKLPRKKSRAASERRRPPLSRVAIWAPLLVVLALAIALTFGIWRHMQEKRQQEEFAKKTSEVSAEFIVAKRDSKPQELILPGNIAAVEEATIYARANGYIKRWLVDIGARVTSGQLLAEIETPEVEQQLLQAAGALKQSEANFEIARVTAQRWKELVEQKVVSKQENDEKQSTFQAATASLAAAKANVGQLQQLLAFNQVTAPFSGTITTRKIDVGALVSAGGGSAGTPLFTLARADPVETYVRVPEENAPSIRDGMAANIIVQELKKRDFTGKVVRNSGALDFQSRTLLTQVEIQNHDGTLLAGMYAQVKFTLADKNAPLIIPSTAFVFRGTGTQVVILDKDNKVHWQRISAGRDFGTRMEVTKGLEENARVVLNPTDDLREGLQVTPKPADQGKSGSSGEGSSDGN
jgi:RND family efflux transporter MFP subunit